MNEAVLPYAGTSGWSGSTTSLDRAIDQDTSGKTLNHQLRVLELLEAVGDHGATWIELSGKMEEHHGIVTGALSNLHKVGKIARLRSRRGRCEIYVLPQFVNGRSTATHKSNQPKKLSKSDYREVERRIKYEMDLNGLMYLSRDELAEMFTRFVNG